MSCSIWATLAWSRKLFPLDPPWLCPDRATAPPPKNNHPQTKSSSTIPQLKQSEQSTTTPNTSPNIMKFSGGGNSEILCGGGPVDTLLLTSCWGGAGGGNGTEHFLMDAPGHKLVMDSCSTTDEDSATKATMDALDSLLLTSSSSQNSPPGSNSNFAELKPLPPFTGYTGHLSINGIPGHHFHAIAAPQSPQSPHNTVSSLVETNNNNAHTTNHNTNSNVVFKAGNNNGSTTLYYTVSTTADQSVVSSSTVDGVSGGIKPEFVDYSLLPPEIEDIAAIIGSAIADTTVPNVDGLVGPGEDPAASRDSWMDLDAWIDTACGENNVQNGGGSGKAIISAESLQEFVANSQFVVSVNPEDCVTTGPSSTLQSLLTQGLQQQQQAFTQQAALLLKREPSTTNTTNYQHHHMPLLQNRLQNGPPSLSNGAIKPESTSTYLSECPSPSSSTPYLSNKEIILPHTTTGSPPGHVVSTTDNSLLMNGGRYQGVHQRNRPGYSHIRSLKAGGVPSPDLLVNGGSLDSLVTGSSLVHGNYPHTTAATTTTPSPSKSKSRSRSGRKQHSGGGGGGGGGASVIYTADGSGGMIGKEKPVHRCTICNRGFLNKSNIKVHLRTHTGEKPFRCEVCGKAFRQKAHLIKHQQIHKRVGRD